MISLQDEDNRVLEGLFTQLKSNCKSSPDQQDFRSLFLEEQERINGLSDKRGRRWHPLVIRWCFHLYSTSPKAYQQLKDSGILTLPDSRTLRDYSNCYKSGLGFDPSFLDLVKKDFIERSDPKDTDSWLGLIDDEVSIRKDLVFDDTGKLIGFVDLGSTQNSIDELEKSLSSDVSSTVPEEATHMFVFMAVSLFSNWKMPVAFFPATTIKCYALFNIFFGSVLRN